MQGFLNHQKSPKLPIIRNNSKYFEKPKITKEGFEYFSSQTTLLIKYTALTTHEVEQITKNEAKSSETEFEKEGF